MVQDFIYRNSLYLREPQYKRILRAGDLEFSHISQPDRHLWEELTEVPLPGAGAAAGDRPQGRPLHPGGTRDPAPGCWVF